jgi:hypothetical protein
MTAREKYNEALEEKKKQYADDASQASERLKTENNRLMPRKEIIELNRAK